MITRRSRRATASARPNKKGQVEYSVAMLGIELIILAVILFTLAKIIANVVQPHFQIAYANAELLRSTIDGLCERGSGSAELANWNFPQPMPMTVQAGGAEMFKNVLPKFMIKARGDPHFLLYYEAFPTPNAFGWEVYQNLGNRTIVPLRGRDSGISSGANIALETLMAAVRSNVGGTVIIPNIVLGNKENETLPGSVGTWTSENFYSLAGYDLLPEIDKSTVKYRACGDYALCMKTKDGIIKLPLPNCQKRGIDYIQTERTDWDKFKDLGLGTLETLGFSAADIAAIKVGQSIQGVGAVAAGAKMTIMDGVPLKKTITKKALIFVADILSVLIKKPTILAKVTVKLGGKIISGVGWTLLVIDILAGLENLASGIAAFFFDTSTDFYLSSPCELDMSITVGSCECGSLISEKLFKYDNATNSLSVVGNYNTCWDKINGGEDLAAASPDCILIEYGDAEGFCRTKDVLLPLEGFSTSIGEAAVYDQTFQAVKLLSAADLRPGMFSFGSGWVWPGER